MNMKEYQTPKMRIFILSHQTQLLSGSCPPGSEDDYCNELSFNGIPTTIDHKA